MKSVKLAFRLFYRNIAHHSLLILQLVLVFIIGSSVVSEINGFFYQKNIIEPLDENNYVFLQCINEREMAAGSINQTGLMDYKKFDLASVKKELIGETSFITQKSIFAKSIDKTIHYDISCFDQKLLNNFNLPILRGDSFATTNKTQGLVRFITDCSDFNIGDSFPIIIENNGKEIEITLLVVGIAKTPFYGPTTSSTATIPDASTVLSEHTKSDKNFVSGLICTEDIPYELNFAVSYDFNYHIFFDESLSDNEIKKNTSILKQYGNVSAGTEIIDTTNKNIIEALKIQLPDIIFISLIALVGFCGISLINISSNMPLFALYSMLGCSDIKCYIILFCYVLIIDLSALLPAVLLLISAMFSEYLAQFFPFVNFSTFAIVLIIALLFFLISFAFVLFSFRKRSTKQLLGGD